MTLLELRCVNRLARTLAPLGRSGSRRTRSPLRSSRSAAESRAVGLVWVPIVLAAVAAVVVLGIVLDRWASLVLLAAVLVVAACFGFARAVGSLWWAAGAGAPVLRIADETVSGRIRPAPKGTAPDRLPDDWWDFVIPAGELEGVELVHGGPADGSCCLLVGVPSQLGARLLASPATEWYAKAWLRYGGSPVGYPVGRMVPRRERRARVQDIVDTLGRVGRGSAPPAG